MNLTPDPRFLPASLRGETLFKPGTTPVARPESPKRSALLAKMLAQSQAKQKGWGDVIDAAGTAGVEAYQGYKKTQPQKGDTPETAEQRKAAGMGQTVAGVAQAAGGLL